MMSDKGETTEDRRKLWTTYDNIKTWFDNWEKDLIDLGFAEKDADDKTVIPNHQLHNIITMDETCLSLDCSKSMRGGRP